MQVNSINNFKVQVYSRASVTNKLNDCQKPVPAKLDASVYFTGGEGENANSGKGMRKILYPVIAIPLLSTSLNSCDDIFGDVHAHAEAIARDTIVIKDTINNHKNDSINQNDTTINRPEIPVRTERDTIYIDPYADGDEPVVVDEGDYINNDSIDKWSNDWERPELLDSLMRDMYIFGQDSTTDDIHNPKAKRNIIHIEADREWEYNNRDIDDINMLESHKGVDLTFDTQFKDYKGRNTGYGKMRLAYPKDVFTVKTADGERVWTSPSGYYLEFYKNPTSNKHTSIKNCKLDRRFFCQTVGDSLKVFEADENGDYIEAGKAAKGYIARNSILLRGKLIGRNKTDDHFVNVHMSVVDDDKLKALYLRQKDDAAAAGSKE